MKRNQAQFWDNFIENGMFENILCASFQEIVP
jgi:hypothetical protein